MLTVEAEVFGERLRAEHFEAARLEVAHGPGVALQVARGEALVRRVEEREQLALLSISSGPKRDQHFEIHPLFTSSSGPSCHLQKKNNRANVLTNNNAALQCHCRELKKYLPNAVKQRETTKEWIRNLVHFFFLFY